MFCKLRMLDGAVRNPTLKLFNAAIVIFRFEEMSLLRAECYARTNNIAAARTELNTLRVRRYIEEVPATATKEQLLDLILEERRRELIGEGWRWFDLMSFDKVPAYSRLQQMCRMAGAYWPMSKSTLGLNPPTCAIFILEIIYNYETNNFLYTYTCRCRPAGDGCRLPEEQ